jgi:hypothetical protein
MTTVTRFNGLFPWTGAPPFSRDTVLEMLSNRRRRFTLHVLKAHGREPVSVETIVQRVARWEGDLTRGVTERAETAGREATATEKRRVRNALRQFHLPKLVETGFVEYDTDEETVQLTEAAAEADFYVDSLTGGAVPWGVYYLCLSVIGIAVLVIATRTGVLSLLEAVVFLTTALCLSSVAHFYDNYYRMRLGAREVPSEVRQQCPETRQQPSEVR